MLQCLCLSLCSQTLVPGSLALSGFGEVSSLSMGLQLLCGAGVLCLSWTLCPGALVLSCSRQIPWVQGGFAGWCAELVMTDLIQVRWCRAASLIMLS